MEADDSRAEALIGLGQELPATVDVDSRILPAPKAATNETLKEKLRKLKELKDKWKQIKDRRYCVVKKEVQPAEAAAAVAAAAAAVTAQGGTAGGRAAPAWGAGTPRLAAYREIGFGFGRERCVPPAVAVAAGVFAGYRLSASPTVCEFCGLRYFPEEFPFVKCDFCKACPS